MVRSTLLVSLLALAAPAWAHHTEPVAPRFFPNTATDCYVACDMVPGFVAHSACYTSPPTATQESGLCACRCNHVGAPFFFKSGFNACDSPCQVVQGAHGPLWPFSSAEEWTVRLANGRLQYWCDSDCHYPGEDDEPGAAASTVEAQWSEVAPDAWVQWAPGKRSYRFLYRERGKRPRPPR